MNFTWQGKSCDSTSRLLVHEACHEEPVGRLAERMDAMRSGVPSDEDTETGAASVIAMRVVLTAAYAGNSPGEQP